MVQRNSIFANLDWLSILLWVVMIAFGWMNIYSSNIMEASGGIFDLSQRFGKQLIWIGASVLLAMLMLVLAAFVPTRSVRIGFYLDNPPVKVKLRR